jgi:hypothetical protein
VGTKESGALQKFNHVRDINQAHQSSLPDIHHKAMSKASKIKLAKHGVSLATSIATHLADLVTFGAASGSKILAKRGLISYLDDHFHAELEKAHSAIPSGKHASQKDRALAWSIREAQASIRRSAMDRATSVKDRVVHGFADEATVATRMHYLAGKGLLRRTEMPSHRRAPSAKEQKEIDRKWRKLLKHRRKADHNSPHARETRRREKNSSFYQQFIHT